MNGWIQMRNGAWVSPMDGRTVKAIEVNASGTHYEAWIRYSDLDDKLIGTAPTAVRAAKLFEEAR